ARRPRLTFDHDPLTQPPREAVGDDARESVGPPGGKPWSIVIGRSGQSGLARTGAAASIAKGTAIAMRRVSSVTSLFSHYPSRSTSRARILEQIRFEWTHLFRSFPRKRESRGRARFVIWVPAFAGTNGPMTPQGLANFGLGLVEPCPRAPHN